MCCERCGDKMREGVVYIRTQRIRFCKCGKENNWPLEEGQAPIGYNIDKDLDPQEGDDACSV